MKINKKLLSKKTATNVLLVFMAILIAVGAPMTMMKKVAADQYDDRIAALQQDISNYNNQASQLANQAKTLQSAIAGLQSQAAVIQAQIDISQAKYDKLVSQIADTEKQIKNNQDALGKTIASMYVDDRITPLEMLASSNSIGDYLDKQEYRSSIRSQLTGTISKIKDLKAQLEKQKSDIKAVLDNQTNEKVNLVATQAKQQDLLTQTQGQESAYQQLASKNNAEINELRAQQAAVLAARASNSAGRYTSSQGDGNKGGYPLKWLNGGLDAYVDDWGMYTRECVSYASFRVNQAYGNMPYWGGIGHAWQWAFSGWAKPRTGEQVSYNTGVWHTANTTTYGIPTGSTPKVGSVGVINGQYGHVAWVEKVHSDGTIDISHFNINWNGDYAYWTDVDPSFFDKYIYFGEWKR